MQKIQLLLEDVQVTAKRAIDWQGYSEEEYRNELTHLVTLVEYLKRLENIPTRLHTLAVGGR